MVRKSQVHSSFSRRKGSGFHPVAVATGCFAALLLTVYVWAGSDSSSESSDTQVVQVETIKPQPVANVVPQARTTEEKPVVASIPEKQPVDQVQAKVASLSERVSEHVASGEFSRALELAKSSAQKDEQSQLLKLVAKAQAELGEFDAAFASIRMMAASEKRDQINREVSPRTKSGRGWHSGPISTL